MSTARTSRRTPRWPGGSSRSWCRSRRVDDAIEILRGLRDRYEAHHQVRYADEALVAAVELSDRYITDRFLPDKAIDLIDQAGARVRLRIKTPRHRPARPGAAGRGAAAGQGPGQSPASSTSRPRSSGTRSSELRRQIEQLGRGREPRCRRSASATSPRSSPGPPASRSRSSPRRRRTGCCGLEQHLHERVIGQDEAVARGRRGGPPVAGRARRPEPAGRQLPVPRADRRRQDRAGARADRGAVRRGQPDDPARHERVPGAAHGQPPGRRPARLRRLRGGRPAHRGGPPAAVLGGAARRDREGAPGCVQHPAAGARRRPADRRPGPDRGLQEHGPHHDQQPGLGPDHQARRRAGLRRRSASSAARVSRTSCRTSSCAGSGNRSGRSS